MKTIYSMQEFHNKVLELAKTKDETYINVECRIDSNRKVTFSAYINGCSWQRGDTMEEALQKLRDEMYGETIKNIDVEVESELLVDSEK